MKTPVPPATRPPARISIKLDEIHNNAPVFYSAINVGASNGVEGFVMDPNGYHNLHTVKVAQ